MSGDNAKIRIGVVGASGYTGADLIRLLAGHPRSEIALMTANAQAGKPLAAVFPHLGGLALPDLIRVEDADWSAVDVPARPAGLCRVVRPLAPRAGAAGDGGLRPHRAQS